MSRPLVLVFTALAAATTLVVPTGEAAAQPPTTDPRLRTGARVRVTVPPRAIVTGTLLAYGGDSLMVRRAGSTDTLRAALGEVRRLEVSAGRHRRIGKGALLGLVSGGVVGALVGAAAYEPDASTFDFGRGLDAAAGGVVGALAGVVAGAAIGARQVERWQPVSHQPRTSRVRLTPAGRHDRFTIVVAVVP